MIKVQVMLINSAFFLKTFHPGEAGEEREMHREGSKDQSKKAGRIRCRIFCV